MLPPPLASERHQGVPGDFRLTPLRPLERPVKAAAAGRCHQGGELGLKVR